MEQMFRSKAGEAVLISSMQPGDLDAADHVTRLAFGTFLGMPDPSQFMGDANFIHTRWKADPAAAFCARMDNEVEPGAPGILGSLPLRKASNTLVFTGNSDFIHGFLRRSCSNPSNRHYKIAPGRVFRMPEMQKLDPC